MLPGNSIPLLYFRFLAGACVWKSISSTEDKPQLGWWGRVGAEGDTWETDFPGSTPDLTIENLHSQEIPRCSQTVHLKLDKLWPVESLCGLPRVVLIIRIYT